MNRKFGILPAAHAAYVDSCAAARIPAQAEVQTVGYAIKSAGTHAPDGTFINSEGDNEPYCAATDFSVLRPNHLSGGQVSRLLLAMLERGFAPFWRHEGTFQDGPHIHAIWADCKMKPQLQAQLGDFVVGRSGLVGHRLDSFWASFIDQHAWERYTSALVAAQRAHNG